MIATERTAFTPGPGSAETMRPPAQAAPAADPNQPDSAITLAPRTLAGIFDGAFDIYKRHFATLALIVALVFIPTQIFLHAAGNLWLRPLTIHFREEQSDPVQAMQIFFLRFFLGAPNYGVPGFLSLLTSFMASGPVAVAVANILLGRPITIGAAYRRALPVFWRLFWTWQILGILFLVIYLSVFLLISVIFALAVGLLTQVGFPASMVASPEAGIVLVVLWLVLPYLLSCAAAASMFSFAPPLIALENARVFSSTARNQQLAGRNLFLRTWLAVTVLPIVTFGLHFLILLSANSVVSALSWPAWAVFVASTGLSSVISFFFQPYWMIFLTLLYFDSRIRREGLNIRVLADNSAPPQSPENGAMPDIPQAPESQGPMPPGLPGGPAAPPRLPPMPPVGFHRGTRP